MSPNPRTWLGRVTRLPAVAPGLLLAGGLFALALALGRDGIPDDAIKARYAARVPVPGRQTVVWSWTQGLWAGDFRPFLAVDDGGGDMPRVRLALNSIDETGPIAVCWYPRR